MGLVEPPFLPQIHPESPGNGVSDVPDFKILWGSMPPGPPGFSRLWLSQIRTPHSQDPGSTPGFLYAIDTMHIEDITWGHENVNFILEW